MAIGKVKIHWSKAVIFSQGVTTLAPGDHIYDFSYAVSSNLIFHPQLTSGLEVPATLEYFAIPDASRDLLAISDPNIVRSGAEIQVAGTFNQPAQDSLQAAGEDYPDWVVEHYLQLPPNLSPKISELAREATQSEDTPFDITQRLTDFLRGAYRYQNAVKIPRGAEPLEWFLFSGKTGFCNYYASAETVMLRTLGIPARFVVGYASGQKSADGSHYTILARNSHAWVEVYFPEIGWVIFEPTPLLPSVTFAESQAPETEEEIDPHERFALSNPAESKGLEEFRQLQEKYGEDSGALAQEDSQESSRWVWLFIPLSFLLVGLAGWWHFFHIPQGNPIFRRISEESTGRQKMPAWLRGWARRSGISPLEKMVARIRQAARMLGMPPGRGETPREFLTRFYQAINFPAQAGQEFMDAYQLNVYGKDALQMDRRQLKHFTAIYHDMLWAVVRKKWGDLKQAIRFRLKLMRAR